MLVHIEIGAVVMLGFMLLFNWTQKNKIQLNWWQWTLTVLAFLYAIVVLETIVLFASEGMEQGMATMGGLTAFIGVIWAVLLQRYIFAPKKA